VTRNNNTPSPSATRAFPAAGRSPSRSGRPGQPDGGGRPDHSRARRRLGRVERGLCGLRLLQPMTSACFFGYPEGNLPGRSACGGLRGRPPSTVSRQIRPPCPRAHGRDKRLAASRSGAPAARASDWETFLDYPSKVSPIDTPNGSRRKSTIASVSGLQQEKGPGPAWRGRRSGPYSGGRGRRRIRGLHHREAARPALFPQGKTMFVELSPEETGVRTENRYADPRMRATSTRSRDLVGRDRVAIGDYDGGRPARHLRRQQDGGCRLFHNLALQVRGRHREGGVAAAPASGTRARPSSTSTTAGGWISTSAAPMRPTCST